MMSNDVRMECVVCGTIQYHSPEDISNKWPIHCGEGWMILDYSIFDTIQNRFSALDSYLLKIPDEN